ncbi:MAG: hypothetical protein OXD30_14640 [Bryobacterales bacterium]|nr:hypothetical protein [Bryobacterales bacterium]
MRKSRDWFFNSLDWMYQENFVSGLPAGQRHNRRWSINDCFLLQAKLTPRQTLSACLVAKRLHAPLHGRKQPPRRDETERARGTRG